GDYLVRAQASGFVLLAQRRGKGRDFAAPGVKEAQCQMTEATDAHHTDPVGGLDVEFHKRVEHRRTGAEQRAGHGRVESIRYRKSPGPVRTRAVGEASVAADDGGLDCAT